MEIKINDKNVELKFKFRSEMLFENVMGHSFGGANISEWCTYFFCTVIACTEDGFISYDDFLTYLDDNTDVFYAFIEWYTKTQESIIELRKSQILNDETKKKKAKKK